MQPEEPKRLEDVLSLTDSARILSESQSERRNNLIQRDQKHRSFFMDLEGQTEPVRVVLGTPLDDHIHIYRKEELLLKTDALALMGRLFYAGNDANALAHKILDHKEQRKEDLSEGGLGDRLRLLARRFTRSPTEKAARKYTTDQLIYANKPIEMAIAITEFRAALQEPRHGSEHLGSTLEDKYRAPQREGQTPTSTPTSTPPITPRRS
jgi:hypothetical protein